MFVYFIPLTVNLTKNSKLERFVHELNALWKLSESSMGALRELVAVAGICTIIRITYHLLTILDTIKMNKEAINCTLLVLYITIHGLSKE
jgi:hypothetical protein